MTTVRAIDEAELDWYAALDPETPGLAATLRGLWASGDGRPEWALVAEREGRPVGRGAMFTEPLGCGLDELEGRIAGLWVARDLRDAANVARQLLDSAVALATPVTAFVERRLNPEIHRDVNGWRAILAACSFELFQEKAGFGWTDDSAPLTEPGRLRFTSLAEAGREAFAAAMAAVIPGTLDRNDRFYVEACGPAAWGRQMVEFVEPGDEPAWLLGHDADGLAGYVAVGAFENEIGTIVHIGVAPDRRGRGYVDDLLRAAAIAARRRGYRTMLSDVDTENAPMIAAMERNGHRSGVREWHVWAYRRATGSAVMDQHEFGV